MRYEHDLFQEQLKHNKHIIKYKFLNFYKNLIILYLNRKK